LIALGISVFTSFVIADRATARDPNAAFFLIKYRFWELGLGALTAICFRKPACSTRVHSFLAAIGLVLVLYSIAAFEPIVRHPSRWTLLPVVGTSLILAFGTAETFTGRMLGVKILSWLGLLSYSAYLWHQPLFAFARLRFPEAVNVSIFLLLGILSFILAWATWHWIEQPFRDRQRVSLRSLLATVAAAIALLATSGAAFHLTAGVPIRLPEQAIAALQWSTDFSPHRPNCHATPLARIKSKEACILGKNRGKVVNIWADSLGVEIAWNLGCEPNSIR